MFLFIFACFSVCSLNCTKIQVKNSPSSVLQYIIRLNPSNPSNQYLLHYTAVHSLFGQNSTICDSSTTNNFKLLELCLYLKHLMHLSDSTGRLAKPCLDKTTPRRLAWAWNEETILKHHADAWLTAHTPAHEHTPIIGCCHSHHVSDSPLINEQVSYWRTPREGRVTPQTLLFFISLWVWSASVHRLELNIINPS